MPDLKTILERESHTVEAPDDFDRLVRRRDRNQRNRRIGAAVLALVLAGFAIGFAVRAFQGAERRTPADGSSVAPTLACPPGSTPDEQGPIDQARPPGGMERMAFDRSSGKIVLLVAQTDGSSSTWTFDVCSNTWLRMHPASEPASPPVGWLKAAYDAASDRTLLVGYDRVVWAYDFESDTWTRRSEVPAPAPFRLVPDPVSGRVLFLSLADRAELWAYDVEADAWTQVQQEGTPLFGTSSDHNLLAYDVSADRIVMYDGDDCSGCPNGDRTWLLDPRTGAWTEIDTSTPDVNTGMIASAGEIAYDEATRRTVVFSDGFVIAYDATADRWTRLYGRERCCQEGPLNRGGHWMVYDPLNERLVVYGGTYRTPEGWVKADDVWAFDAATGEWIQLLAPSEAPSAETS